MALSTCYRGWGDNAQAPDFMMPIGLLPLPYLRDGMLLFPMRVGRGGQCVLKRAGCWQRLGEAGLDSLSLEQQMAIAMCLSLGIAVETPLQEPSRVTAAYGCTDMYRCTDIQFTHHLGTLSQPLPPSLGAALRGGGGFR